MDTRSWKPININEIFDISYGNKLDMCKMTPDEDGIPFVTRTATNNGVGGMVEPVEGITPYPAGSLSIALGGSIGSTFLQTKEFYTSQNVAVLQPKSNLDSGILLFLARLIEKECSKRFVAFGRELNKHIKRDFTIKLPLIEKDKPNWSIIASIVKDQIIPQLPKKAQKVWLQKYDTKPQLQEKIKLNTQDWKWFSVENLFALEVTKGSTTDELTEGNEIPYIAAKHNNNGCEMMCAREDNLQFISKGNCIVFICLGAGSAGYALYQGGDFIGMSGKTMCGYNPNLNQYNGIFLATILSKERPKYSFGRSWTGDRLRKTRIKLPVTPSGEPDWKFMEDYIKSLPFSKNIEPSKPNEVVDELVEMKKEMIKMRRAMEAQQHNDIHYHIDTYNDNSTTYNIKK